VQGVPGDRSENNRVVVTADRTVTGAKLTQLTEVATSIGDAVVVTRTNAVLKKADATLSLQATDSIEGGNSIYGNSARCTLGFNVIKDGNPFLTAGHSFPILTNPSGSGPVRRNVPCMVLATATPQINA
jgi:hypothetical protein